MPKRLILTSLLAALCIAVYPALAQQAPPDAAQPAAEPKVIKQLELLDMPLAEVIEVLREQDPSFQAVVSYATGAKRGGPIIQEIRLKNVTTDAVMKLLADSYPQIHINEASGPNDSILYTVRVGPDNDQPDANEVVTSVHRLNEILDALAQSGDKADGRKKAMFAVLALVQAAVETENEGEPGARPASHIKIRLHEATETLIFKGTRDQTDLVTLSLNSLQPSEETKLAEGKRQIEEAHLLVRRLEGALDEAQRRRSRAEDELTDLKTELERMRLRLEDAERRAGTAQPAPQPQPQAEKPKQP